MKIQQLTVKDTLINVRYTETDGPTIVFVHGNSAGSFAFDKQLVGEPGKKYRCIALDLPGHGASADAADNSIYSLPGYAEIVAGVAEQMNATDGVFVGWSLGGHIVLEAADTLSNAKGFLIFGTPPLGKPPAMEAGFLPHPANGVLFNSELSDEEIRTFAAAQMKLGGEAPQALIDAVKRTDINARAGLGGSVAAGNFTDELQIVTGLRRPLAIVHGEHEQLVNGNYFGTIDIPTLWKDAVQIIPDAGHMPQWENPAAFNATLLAFVADALA